MFVATPYDITFILDKVYIKTRRFSNHESRLLSRSHTFAIIVILDLKIHQSMWIHWPFFPKTWTKGHWPLFDLWPHVCWGHMCDSTQGSLCPSSMGIHQCMWIKDLRGNPKPRVSPDRTGPKPVRGRGTVLRIFRVGSGRVGEFYFGSVWSGYFFTGVWAIFSRDFGDKLAFHSQTEKAEMAIILDKHVVWCYNFIAGHIHVFIVVWSLIRSLNLWSQHKIFSIPQNFRVGPGRNC